MYNYLKSKSIGVLAKESPILLFSALIAELFYKLGSFTLELLAFAITWYGVSSVLHFLFQKK